MEKDIIEAFKRKNEKGKIRLVLLMLETSHVSYERKYVTFKCGISGYPSNIEWDLFINTPLNTIVPIVNSFVKEYKERLNKLTSELIIENISFQCALYNVITPYKRDSISFIADNLKRRLGNDIKHHWNTSIYIEALKETYMFDELLDFMLKHNRHLLEKTIEEFC